MVSTTRKGYFSLIMHCLDEPLDVWLLGDYGMLDNEGKSEEVTLVISHRLVISLGEALFPCPICKCSYNTEACGNMEFNKTPCNFMNIITPSRFPEQCMIIAASN